MLVSQALVRWGIDTQGQEEPTSRPQPLADAMRSAMREHRLTYRALARKTRAQDPGGKGLSHGYLASLGRGEEDHPSHNAMLLLAQALDLHPEQFAEWQLREARTLFDETEVGLQTALANLRLLQGVLASRRSEGLRPQLSAASQTPLRGRPKQGQAPFSETNINW